MATCIDCKKKINEINNYKGRCGSCHAAMLNQDLPEHLKLKKPDRFSADDFAGHLSRKGGMVVTTEAQVDFPIAERCGIVSSEVVVGMNVLKDFMTGVRNVVGGRTGNVQKVLRDIRLQAIEELKDEAAELGADAVIAVSLDYNEIGATGSTMLMLVAHGTAVKRK
ncbi:YbjQ family protein [Shimia marina]|uniref:UPF0145 protein SHM7688_03886 n=1 Tax=Shimia marina TaxID=321267 RepID=A0A0P1EUY8_9RHOB|nr:YbjQ family protein [Shimia marina]CUH54415.1 hypothetical protein SHM7688_03886 [Shimia marina]SFE03175.1 Uncharacterized conserved protein YbjQ, UPF0145 family [Shimia marina]